MRKSLSKRGRKHVRDCRKVRNRRSRFELLEDRALLSISAVVPQWLEEGPGPIINDATHVAPEDVNSGAVSAIAPDPSNPDIVYIGTVNGGIWKSTQATNADPDWRPLTDQFPSLSIASLAISPLDDTPGDGPTLYAGTGRLSSFNNVGISHGFLKSTDGGNSWSVLPALSQEGTDVTDFGNLTIDSIVPTGINTATGQVLLAATREGIFQPNDHVGGLYRSTDGGESWVRLTGTGNLPEAGVSDIAADPSSDTRFYAAVPGHGVFRSEDVGATWQNITNNIASLLPSNALTDSVRMHLSVSAAGNHPVYASVLAPTSQADKDNVRARLIAVVRSDAGTDGSDNNGTGGVDDAAEATWARVGTAPIANAGGQGRFHASLLADNLSPHVVYVGGDRVPNLFQGLFNPLVPDASIWVPMTGFGANNTSTHADSRTMVFAQNGTDILEGDDGGIYRLAGVHNPLTRSWVSMNTSLRSAEFFSVAYDNVNDQLFGGTMDNGLAQQSSALGGLAWGRPALPALVGGGFADGDGNSVAVDTTSTPNRTIRYEMLNNLNLFFRHTFNTSDTQVAAAKVTLAGNGSVAPLSGLNKADREFTGFDRVHYVLNAVQPQRMLIGRTGVYESFNRGDTLIDITPPGLTRASALAYGGMENGVAKPDIAYIGGDNGIVLREGPGRGLFLSLSAYEREAGGQEPRQIIMDPDDWRIIYVVDGFNVFRATLPTNFTPGNNPEKWEVLTGNLRAMLKDTQVEERAEAGLNSIEVVKVEDEIGIVHTVLLVGGAGGVYRLMDPGSGNNWTEFGVGIPNTVVTEVHHDRTDDKLFVSTFGRGVWSLPNASTHLLDRTELRITFDSDQDVVHLFRDPSKPSILNVLVNGAIVPEQHQFTNFDTITVIGQGGSSKLIVDVSNGVFFDRNIDPSFTFDGGGSNAKVVLQGAPGSSATIVNDFPTTGVTLIGLAGDNGSFGFMRVTGATVDDQITLSPMDILEHGLTRLINLSRELAAPALLGQNLPVIGDSLGAALNGDVDAGQRPLVVDEPGLAGTAAKRGLPEERDSILRRILETGTGAFRVANIGAGITTPEELRDALDGLDGTPNVFLTKTSTATTFDVTVEKTLSGLADIDIEALGGLVNLTGAGEILADIKLHIVFGVDQNGFFIDANANPDPTFVVDLVTIDGPVDGTGRFGFTDVDIVEGTLRYDPDVEVGVTLREPGPDAFTGATDGKIRVHELDLVEQIATGSLTQNLAGDDVIFFATLQPISLDPLDPNSLLGLGPSEVILSWPDVTDRSQEPAIGPDDAPLLPFLDIVANQLTLGGMQIGSALHSLSQTDGNVLSEDLALTGTSVGEILSSPVEQVRPVDFDDSSILHISAIFEDADFKKFHVVTDVNLPELGVATGDAVSYKDQNGNVFVDGRQHRRFGIRRSVYKIVGPAGLHVSTPSFVIARSGAVEHQLAAFLNPLVDQAVVGLVGPTLQGFVERLAAVTGVPIGEIDLTGDLSGSNPFLQIGFDLTPDALVFDQNSHRVQAFRDRAFETGSDFAVTLEPSYRLDLGLDMRTDVSVFDRFFTVGGASPAISFDLSAELEVPTFGYEGQVGYLNIGLTPNAKDNGAQIDGTFSVGLTDPGTLAQDGRISLGELQLPNPDATAPGFKITRASGELSISDANVVTIEDAEPVGNLNKFTVTLASAGLLSGVANGDVVRYKDNSGRERTGTIDSFSDGDGQFTSSYAITPLFDADIEADFNIEALKIASNVSNSTSNLGDLIVSLDGSGPGAPGHVTSLAELEVLASKIQVQGNKQSFLDYLNLAPEQIFTALKLLATRLADLADEVNVDLPLLSFDVSKLTDFQAAFETKIQSLSAAQIPSAQELVDVLRAQFPGLTLTLNGSDLQFALALSSNVNSSFPISVDIGTGSLTGNGQVNVVGQGNLNLGVGFSTAPNLEVPDRFFLSAGGNNGFSASLKASAGYDVDGNGSPDSPPLQFSAGVGPLSVSIKDARVLLDNVKFAATIQGGSDGNAQRLTFREITDNIGSNPASIVAGGFTSGSLQAVLPIDGNGGGVDPLPTNLTAGDAWIDVAGLIANIGSPALNTNPNVVTHHTGFGGTPTVDKPLNSTELNFNGTPVAGKFVVSAYNVGGLLDTLANFDPNDLDLKGGLDKYLGNLESNLLGGPIIELPLLGDKIKGILKFVDDLQLAVAKLPANADAKMLENAFTVQLGDILDDIDVVASASGVEFQLLLSDETELDIDMTGSLGIPGLELKVDSGTFRLATGYDFQFNFGVSKNDGFYIDTNASSLEIDFSATIDDFKATGDLFFLQVDVNKLPANEPIKDITIGGGELKVDLRNPFSSNSRLTLTELTSGGFDPLDLFGAKLKLSTDIPLHLKVSFDGDKSIPSIETDFAFHWDFLEADTRGSSLDFGGVPAIAFNDVSLDLGSFVNQFVQPMMDVVNDILDPIRPIVDVLNTRLPGFSDLPDGIISLLKLDEYDHNKEVSLLDFAQKFLGDSQWGAALKVYQFIDSTSRNFRTGESGTLNLGDFVISAGTPDAFDVRGLPDLSSFTKDPFGAIFDTAEELVNEHLSDKGAEGVVKRFLQSSITNVSQELGGKRLIELPIIEKPTTAFNLLLGRDVNLVLFNPPKLEIPLQIDMIFGLFGIVGVRVVGGVKATMDFRFGFDTFGLREFVANPSDGAEQIFDGFFTTNRANADGTGDKVPQVLVDARVTIGGGVDVFIASASVNGGIYTRGPGPNPFQLTATLCDDMQIANDGNPGKLRFRDLHGFEMQGDLRAGIFAEVTIGRWPLKHTEIFPFAEKVLINLNHPCKDPEPILANFAKPDGTDLPNLTEDKVEVYNNNENGPIANLRLNMGPRAGVRKHKLTTDISEVFIINHVAGVAGDETIDVIAFGTKQRYFHVKDIFADGGIEDDTITLQRTSADGMQKGVSSFAFLLGGPGNDNLNAGDGAVILFGGPGIDSLYGGPQGDLIYGEEDGDVIVAGAGHDRIAGGSKDRPARNDGNDFLVGGDGDDFIAGDNANLDDPNDLLAFDDDKAGKFGDDRIFGGSGKDIIFGTTGNDEIFGEDDDDNIRAGRGHDSVSGGRGNDTLVGARDNDILNGDEGNDFVEGGLGIDQLYGSFGSDRLIGDQASTTTTESGADFLDGGDGDDILVGDNGTIDAQGTVVVNSSGANDIMRGGGGGDRMYGQGGNDFMEGGLGNDTMFGADGNDTLLGQRDNDYAEGNANSDSIQGGPDADRLVGGSTTRDADDSGDNIIGDEGADWIIGDNGSFDVAAGKVQTLDDGKGAKDTIFGGAGDDVIFGGTAGDELIGDALSDLGNDIIVGDDGSATMTLIVAQTSAASGADNLFGSGGNDILLGGDRKDNITGDSGLDVILGDNGKVTRDSNKVVVRIETADPQSGDDDQISGGNDADVALGGTGADTIKGGDDSGADILLGDNGKVILNDPNEPDPNNLDSISTTNPADGGVDDITGGPGDDILVGGALGDKLFGGTDADLIVGDNAFINRNSAGVVLRTSTIDPSMGGSDIIEGNEAGDTAIGGFGDDDIKGGTDGGADILIGDNGVVVGADGTSQADDIFTTDPTFGGIDNIVGGPGKDTILGGSGNADLSDPITCLGDGDDLFGNEDADILIGDNGNIVRDANKLVERIETTFPGQGGNDTVEGNDAEDTILGGFGADHLTGHVGNDVILGDNGALHYTIISGASILNLITTTNPTLGCSDEIHGNEGHDTLMGGTDSETIDGGSGNDLIFGDHGKVDFTLPPERNFFSIDTGVNDGGADDVLFGNIGDDRMLGGQGNDRIFGQENDDDLIGGHNVAGGADGNDIMDSGTGNDSLAGDNASIIRRSDAISPLIRVLSGATLYDANGVPAVTGAFQLNPTGAVGRDVTIYDGASTAPTFTRGNDYMAGGPQHDNVFGQGGNDIMQGDASVALTVSATQPSVADLGGPGSDGDDYMEGNAGNDVLYGNLGQDDLLGGNSDLFGQVTADQRGDGSDTIFGGAGTDVARNTLGDTSANGHARDADVIVGDNGAIYRIVGTNGISSGAFLKFQYDNYGALKVIPRSVKLLDYTLGGTSSDIGAGDLVHGEAGDDSARGGPGNDIIFGEGQDDDLSGQAGNDWISGGAGEDGVIGDDGRIYTTRNGLTETLYGLTVPNAQTEISMPGPFTGAWTFITGRLNKNVDLEAYTLGGDDIIYGGLGDDFLHGGAGNDGISGAEAVGTYYVNPNMPGPNFLGYDPATRKLAAYDADDPFSKIANFFLNFDAADGAGAKINDGKDRLFGDLGHDWLVGGTQNDRLFGGMGDDVHNLDDNHDTVNNNEQPDTVEYADRDFAYGGGGLDVLIANTGGDRMFDWTGEFNSFLVPFNPFGQPTIIRSPSPHVDVFLRDLGRESGNDFSLPEPAFHLDGELGLASQEDPEWGDQHGGPRDPQPGHTHHKRDTKGGPEDDRNTALPLTTPAGPPAPSSGSGPNSQDVTVNNVTVTQDPDNANQRALFVGGGAGNDTIQIRRGQSDAYIKVVVNGAIQEFARGTGTQSINRVVVYGNGGDDSITVFTDLNAAIGTVIFGGDGNDNLVGGKGSNFIDGGDGNDTLFGGSGNDFLVGSRGVDTLRAGQGTDLLVGGLWSQSEDLSAIASVMATWTSSGSLSQKRSALKSGVGASGLYKLNLDTVFDDDVIDQVFGEQQDDWFWLFGQDQNDKRGNDSAN